MDEKTTQRLSLNQFSRIISMRPGTERDAMWKNFLIGLENFLNSLAPGPTASRRPNTVGGSGSGGGTNSGGFPGGGAVAPNPQAAAPFTISVAMGTQGLTVGTLVHYSARSLSLADCRDKDKWANFAVVAINGGFATLTMIAASLPLRILTGRGTNTNGTLYLYRDGTCTDEYTDLVGTDGMPVGGTQITQIVGASQFNQGPSPAGAIRASLLVQPPAYVV